MKIAVICYSELDFKKFVNTQPPENINVIDYGRRLSGRITEMNYYVPIKSFVDLQGHIIDKVLETPLASVYLDGETYLKIKSHIKIK